MVAISIFDGVIGTIFFLVTSLVHNHPEETSKNSDNCDLLKVPDIGKSIVVNGEKTILTIQSSSEKISWKYIYRKI